jgi:tetrahydromethanopterin S-methyltransferase subunit C
MTDTAMWTVIVSFFAPIVLAFIVAQTWPTWAKAVAAFVFSAIVGIVTALLTGSYDGLGIPSTILLSLVVSITAYSSFWSKVGITNRTGTMTTSDGVPDPGQPVAAADPDPTEISTEPVDIPDQTDG